MAILLNNTVNKNSPPPYLDCLVPGISVEAQEKLRNITNSVLLPLDLIMASLSLLSNLLLLVAIARMKNRQHPSLIFLCSLSISDLLWAGWCFYRDIRKATHIYMCPTRKSEANTYISILCLFSTLSNLAVLSKDRHRAVKSPHWYRIHVIRSRALKQASLSWLFSITAVLMVLMLSWLLPQKRFLVYFLGVIFYVTSIIVIITGYIGIFVAGRRHSNNMAQHGRHLSLAVLKREKRLAMTVGFILLALVFTLLPALASPIILTIMGYSKAPFRPFFTLFITFNGLMNPLINCGRNDTIRRSVRDLFACSRAPEHATRSAVVPERAAPLDVSSNHLTSFPGQSGDDPGNEIANHSAAKENKMIQHSSVSTSV